MYYLLHLYQTNTVIIQLVFMFSYNNYRTFFHRMNVEHEEYLTDNFIILCSFSF